jgi:membrane protease YdiL (CAAX protease family)/tetratricopeptide (TPR) repeat protein
MHETTLANQDPLPHVLAQGVGQDGNLDLPSQAEQPFQIKECQAPCPPLTHRADGSSNSPTSLSSIEEPSPDRAATNVLSLSHIPEEDIPTVLDAHPGFGFWAAVGWLLVVWLAQLLVGFCAGLFLGILMGRQVRNLGTEFFAIAGQMVGILSLVGLVWLRLGPQTRRALALRGTGWFHLLLILLLLPPLLVLSEAIVVQATRGLDAVLQTQGEDTKPILTGAAALPAGTLAYIEWIDQLHDTLARQPWIVVLLVGCLLPGIGEELFFRGFLGRGLVARYGPVRGVLLTSLLFGAMHIDPVQACYTFVLGIGLHMVYLTTKSLSGPMLLHTLYNVVGFGIRRLTLEGSFDLGSVTGPHDPSPLLVLTALAAVVGLTVLLYRTRVRWILPDGSAWSPGYATAEMCPAANAVARRDVVRMPVALLAAGGYLVFGSVWAYAGLSWLDEAGARAEAQRGLVHREKGEYEQAIAAYTRSLRQKEKLPEVYALRAEAYRLTGDCARAISDCKRAMELDPQAALPYVERGASYLVLGDTDQALADCNHALRLNERLAFAYSIGGAIYSDRGEHDRAVADWTRALKLEPQHAWTRNALAWLWATCPEAKHCQGRKAVEQATKACEITQWKEAEFLTTLAAAHAECGQFQEAARRQREALRLAPESRKASFAALLRHFQAKRPYRDRSIPQTQSGEADRRPRYSNQR